MKSWLLILFCTTLLGQETERKGLPIIIQTHKTFSDTIFGYGQDVIVEGTVEGDVGSIGGDVHIKGTVKGNISVLNGSVVMYKSGAVGGNLVCVGGSVSIPDPEGLSGKIINYFDPNKEVGASAFSSVKSRIAFFFGQTLLLFLLVVITFYIFPNQVNEASFELSQDVARPVIIGVVTLAVFLIGLFISFLLLVIAIGFPLFVLFFCGLTVVVTFGVVVVFYRLGQFIEAKSNKMLSLVSGILLAVLVIGLLMQVPLIGAMVVLAFFTLGSGIVIETRFGTNKQWFTRKSRYWSAS